jgi:FKBP-type peptidyl-prolyl cis-trans isomerase SlpA
MKNIVKIDSFLTLHYRLSFVNGADIANTFTDKPATVLMGGGHSDPEHDFSAGDMVEFDAPHGGKYAGVLQSIDETGAWFDFNHPLAGKDIIFEVKLISVL